MRGHRWRRCVHFAGNRDHQRRPNQAVACGRRQRHGAERYHRCRRHRDSGRARHRPGRPADPVQLQWDGVRSLTDGQRPCHAAGRGRGADLRACPHPDQHPHWPNSAEGFRCAIQRWSRSGGRHLRATRRRLRLDHGLVRQRLLLAAPSAAALGAPAPGRRSAATPRSARLPARADRISRHLSVRPAQCDRANPAASNREAADPHHPTRYRASDIVAAPASGGGVIPHGAARQHSTGGDWSNPAPNRCDAGDKTETSSRQQSPFGIHRQACRARPIGAGSDTIPINRLWSPRLRFPRRNRRAVLSGVSAPAGRASVRRTRGVASSAFRSA